MRRVVVLTGSELRHDYFRLRLARMPGIAVLRTYCEGREKSLQALAAKKCAELELWHLAAREQSERDFFELYVREVDDRSNPVFVEKGAINAPGVAEDIARLEPDLLVAYGCSLVREPLLSAFEGRFLNVHLGLSPYYRGSGTNYWPFVNGEPEYAGLTFMHIDAGVDTGAIIHQVRPRIYPCDTFHQIGNRLILDMAEIYARIIASFDELTPLPQPSEPANVRTYKSKDFTDASVEQLLRQIRDGLLARYLTEQQERCARVPILAHPALA